MMDLLKFLDARMGEPSTYASLALLLGMMHVNVDPGVLHTISLWGAVAAGVLGVVLAEIGTKTPAQVAGDALAAFVAAVKAMPTEPPKIAAVLLAIGLGLGLTACAQQPDGTLTLKPDTAAALQKLCDKDAQIQPVALAGVETGATVAPALIPGAPGVTVSGVLATGAAIDRSLLHSEVQKACAALPPKSG